MVAAMPWVERSLEHSRRIDPGGRDTPGQQTCCLVRPTIAVELGRGSFDRMKRCWVGCWDHTMWLGAGVLRRRSAR
jgi:hypothetical protein